MIELFAIYKFSFVLCFVAGVVLCVQGLHLVARRESLQILALAQAALVGNLVGRLIYSSELFIVFVSLVFFVIFKIAFLLVKESEAKETLFTVFYLFLLAISYLLISIFPGLEGHMSVGFFGDIVSLSLEMTYSLIITFSILLAIFFFYRKKLLIRTFEKSVLGSSKLSLLEELLFAAVFVCSLYGLGFLFSVSSMIFPAVVIGTKGRNFKTICFAAIAVTVLSSLGGLSLSIVMERLSTVPTQVCLLLIFLITITIFISRVHYEKS